MLAEIKGVCPKHCPRRRGTFYVDVETRQPLKVEVKLITNLFPRKRFPASVKFVVLREQLVS